MLPDGRRLGAHLALADGMVKGADRAAEIGAAALQIFSDNPTAWRRRAAPSPEIPAFRARLAAAGVAPLAIHASYLINLAGSDPAYHERSVALLAAELRSARRFGATIVNVHVGSHGGAGIETGIERLVTAVRRALAAENDPDPDPDPVDDHGESEALEASGAPEGPETSASPLSDSEGTPRATITLENSAGSGFALGTDLAELSAIAVALRDAGVPADRVGFCLDTAHAWGAGHELSDPATIDTLLDGFDRRIGLDRLRLIHLNDSRSELGSRTDRHEHIGAGRIGEIGMGHILRHPRLAGATYILETPGMDVGYDAINIARALALARGETPVPLSPEAFTLRGSRARAAAPVDAIAEPDPSEVSASELASPESVVPIASPSTAAST